MSLQWQPVVTGAWMADESRYLRMSGAVYSSTWYMLLYNHTVLQGVAMVQGFTCIAAISYLLGYRARLDHRQAHLVHEVRGPLRCLAVAGEIQAH